MVSFPYLLRARGVHSGVLVAMLLPRSIDAYVALLGILKAGAAYVPLDPEYPVDRIAFILENSGARALVTTAELSERHADFDGVVIRVDADRTALEASSSARLSRNTVGVGPRDLCYVIYTSGSTGRPKGVMVEHWNACHLVSAEGRIFQVQPEDRVYQGFSLCFDASVEEVWLAFHAGATLVAATPEMAHAGPDVSRMLSEAGVTVLSCVPTLLSMLDEDVPTLRLEARFLPDPFAPPGETDARIYRTGDLGRIKEELDSRSSTRTHHWGCRGPARDALPGAVVPHARGAAGKICRAVHSHFDNPGPP